MSVSTTGKISEATVIDIAKKGTIKFGGTAADDAILMGKFSGSGEVKLDFAKMGTLKTFGTIKKADVAITAKMVPEIILGDNEKTSENEGTLTIEEGTLNFAAADASLVVKQGTLALGEKVKLTASTAGLTAGVVIGGDKPGTLKMPKANFDEFMSATNAGAVDVQASGTLLFTDLGYVDLGGLVVKDSVSAAGDLGVTAGGIIGATNVTVARALSNGKDANATTAIIKAEDTLTLGDGSNASESYKVAGFESKNLTLQAGLTDDGVFKLADKVTLSSTS